MKLSAKIIILISAIVFLAGMTLYLFRLITKPPMAPEPDNQYIAALDEDIDAIDNDLSPSELNWLFRIADNEVMLWQQNKLIGEKTHDKEQENLLQTYIPIYTATTKDRLSSSANGRWGVSERDEITNHISYLRSKKNLSYNNTVVSNYVDLNSELNELEVICNDYNSASNLLNYTNFESLSNSRERINRADEFRNDIYIGNSDLYYRLKNYPDNLGDAHYNYIDNLFSYIRNWRNYSLYTTEDNLDKFKTACDEYSGTAIYGSNHPRSLGSMRSDAEDYMRYAYNEKCSLTVNDYSYNFSYTMESSGRNYTFYVSTDHPDGYKINSIPYFCSLESKNSSSFTIHASDNNSSSSRTGYYISVTAGNKEVRINLTQSAVQASASITNVSTDHNVYQNGYKGMRINVTFNAYNLSGQNLEIVAWFYYENGTRLEDRNNSYHTTDGQVSASTHYTPYSSSASRTVSIFMPYDELHITRSGRTDLKYYVGICNRGNHLTKSSYQSFYYTR